MSQTTMRAALLEEFGRPLTVVERPLPKPAVGEALVRVKAVGLCGTDLKLCDGDLGPGIRLPLVPGHEVAGTVEVSDGNLPVGTPVACYVYETCGHCEWCRKGQATLCPSAIRLGLERDGGLAEFVAVPGANLVPFAESLSFEAAAVAMDSVTTPWAALRGSMPLKEGELVLIVGAGGLGLNAIQIAVASGAKVAALDVSEESRERARQAGAELAVSPDRVEQVREWSDGGVDVMVELSGAPAGFAAGLGCVRPAGRAILCGYKPGTAFPLSSEAVVLGQLTLCGTRNATPEQSREALAAVERGEVTPVISRRFGLEEIRLGMEALRGGNLGGRVVIEV